MPRGVSTVGTAADLGGTAETGDYGFRMRVPEVERRVVRAGGGVWLVCKSALGHSGGSRSWGHAASFRTNGLSAIVARCAPPLDKSLHLAIASPVPVGLPWKNSGTHQPPPPACSSREAAERVIRAQHRAGERDQRGRTKSVGCGSESCRPRKRRQRRQPTGCGWGGVPRGRRGQRTPDGKRGAGRAGR